MQPPPRKGNYAKFLKTLHSEQVLKLQAKNQQECDLLEDIRSYTLKRSAIERSYSEALLKISSVYLNKKIPTIPDIKTDGGAEQWNMWNVWRTVLEENEKLAKARLAAVEVFSQSVVDDSKHLRLQKLAAAKKCVEVLQNVQKELQMTVQEVDKTKKLYFDEEHCAHDVRDKAKDIEEKLKKKKGSFFQSITSLQKNSAKVSSKRDQLEEKSTGARNDYLLSLAAANAHQRRYFLVDLQQAMLTMENDVYERVADYLMLISRTELLTCSATQASFSRIRDQAQQLTREYNLQCVYLYYPVLKQHIQYEFEPCDNDPIDKITAEHSSAVVTLSKEAKRWATKIGRENNSIKENNKKLQTLLALRDSGQKVDPNDPNGPDIDIKIDELRQAIRKSETSKTKAEARIECLRNGGVNVDEFLQDVETLSVQDIPRSSSSMSVRTDASEMGEPPSLDSYYDSDNFEGTPEKKIDGKVDSDEEERRRHDSEVDAMLEQERQRIEQLTAGWDDPTQVEWGTEEQTSAVPSVAVSAPPGEGQAPIIYKCVALYSYTAQNPDELSMVESEQLEVVGEGDGDGWLKARNYRGEEGFVPQNYLDVDRSLIITQGGSSYQLNTQISFSSVDYTVDEENIPGVQESSSEAVVESSKTWSEPPTEAAEWSASTETAAWPGVIEEATTADDGRQWAAEFKPGSGPESTTSIEQEFVELEEGYHYCIALYDYEATAPEELSFVENQVIKLLKKMPHSVDDGWWEGELNGKIGLFPSLVVEVCRADGTPLTPEALESPPASAPPVFTPPEVPTFLVAPEHVIVTQPTPVGESSESAKKFPTDGDIKPATNGGFEMNMSKGQQQMYKKHYDGAAVISSEETIKQAPEVSKTATVQKEKPPSFGSSCLGVAEIVITAATPMLEEPETPFPPIPENDEYEEKDEDEIHQQSEEQSRREKDKFQTRESLEGKFSESEEQTEEEGSTSEAVTTVVATTTNAQTDDNDDQTDDCPTDSAPFPVSSSTGSEDDPSTGPSTGPSTAENSQSNASPPAPIPDPNIPEELDPRQLAKLKSLKESNA